MVCTQGFHCLDPETQHKVFQKIQAYKDWDSGNDPYGEHDFGVVDADSERFYFKIDYWNKDLTEGSSNPVDPKKTCRVMTIMLTSEY